MKNKFWGTDIIIVVVSLLAILLAVALGITNPDLILLSLAGVTAVALF